MKNINKVNNNKLAGDFIDFLKNELKEFENMKTSKAKKTSKKSLYEAGLIDKNGQTKVLVVESYING